MKNTSGRLMHALAGRILKLDPEYDYGSGKNFPPGYAYCPLRLYDTFFSGLSAPAAYMTTRNLGLPKTLSFFAGIFVTLEHGIAFFTRIIILDSFLLSFVSITYCFMLATINAFNKKPFSKKWKLLALCTGLFLGLGTGVKYSGAFISIPICMMVLESLWKGYKNSSVPLRKTISLFLFYKASLIIFPGIILLSGYLIHLSIFTKIKGSTSGLLVDYINSIQTDGILYDENLLYGSLATFNGFNRRTSNLHSHENKYPGTDYYQVTCYPFVDENNHIELLPPEYAFYPRDSFLETELVTKRTPVKNGDLIMLRHNATNGYFGVIGKPSPNTRSEYRVESEVGSGIVNGHPDTVSLESFAHTIWEIRDSRLDPNSREPIKIRGSEIIFTNLVKNCVLRMTEDNLPHWGFNQSEVSCRPYYIKKKSGIIWYAVNQISTQNLSDTANVVPKKVNYFKNIFSLVKSTINENALLVPKRECNSSIDSHPIRWIYDYTINIAYNVPDENGMHGNMGSYNPLILISSTVSFFVTVLCYWYLSLKKKVDTLSGKSVNAGKYKSSFS